jgi:hypothetical protein
VLAYDTGLVTAGAALDALAEGGVTLSPEVVARLTATLPPASFCQT